MTMHHLLTGVDPRPKDYMYLPVRQWNPELSEGIEIIIDKCVQPAAERRYQSCTELLYDLEHPELITRGYKRKQRRKLGTFLAMLVVVVAAFFAYPAACFASVVPFLSALAYSRLIRCF